MIVWVTRWKTPDVCVSSKMENAWWLCECQYGKRLINVWVTRWKTPDECVSNKMKNVWWLCERQDGKCLMTVWVPRWKTPDDCVSDMTFLPLTKNTSRSSILIFSLLSISAPRTLVTNFRWHPVRPIVSLPLWLLQQCNASCGGLANHKSAPLTPELVQGQEQWCSEANLVTWGLLVSEVWLTYQKQTGSPFCGD